MKNKINGFTLIELIVVLATFSIILFGAMSLMTPVNKIMIMSSVHEGGNAAVSNISKYIQTELAPVEYLSVYNEVPLDGSGNIDDAVIRTRISAFVNAHYQGIVRGNSSASSPNYASGTIHVMLIQNNENGKISTMQYTCDFGDSTGVGAKNITQTVSNEFAVNKAYYDDYSYQIKFGNYSNDAEFNAATDSYDSMTTNLNSTNTVLTIRAETIRNNTTYSFFEHAATPLVNIFSRNGAAVQDVYFTTGSVQDTDASGNPKYEADGTTPIMVPGIVDVTDSRAAVTYESQSILPDISGSGNGYCFIYSYSSEINTAP